MKLKLFTLVGIVLLGFSACDELEDATAVQIDTKFDIEVPVEPVGEAAVVLKSVSEVGATYNFGGQKDFSLADNPDLSASINKIKDLVLSGGTIEVPQLAAPNVINSMTIRVLHGTTEISSLTKENLTTNSYSLTSDDLSALQALQSKLATSPNETYTFKIDGTANYEVSTTIKVKFDSRVKATIL